MSDSSLDLGELAESWLLHLRAQRKSPATLRAYRIGVNLFLTEHTELTKAAVIDWLAAMSGVEPGTMRLRLAAVKQFAKWLASEDYLDDADAILMVRAPKLDAKPVPDLSTDEVARMLKACSGKDWRAKRDRAIVRLLAETGLRAGELLALDVADVNLAGCSVLVRRGKGGKARRVQFSPTVAADIDRYRRAVQLAADGPLWLGTHGRLTYTGLRHTLGARAEAAGVIGFHAHRLRHTAAVRWLAAGGSEGGLMAQAGWKSRDMVDRYVSVARETLAAKEFNRLELDADWR